jgi:proline iminopeptidase
MIRRAPVVFAWLAGLATAACAPSPAPPGPARVPAPTPAPVPVQPPPVVVMPAEGRIDVGAAGALWYQVAGSARDTVLVPLGLYLRSALAPLARSHTLIFYDPRHRGRSDSYADTTLSTLDNDVRDVESVRAAFRISRAAIIGFSHFAAVAVAYAARNPDHVSRLVLLSPIEPTDSLAAAYAPPDRRARIDTTAARQLLKMRAGGRDTLALPEYCEAYWRVNAPLFVGDTLHAGRLVPSWCQLANESPRRMGDQIAREMASLGAGYDLSRLAARVAAPTLVIGGGADLIVNPASAAAWARRIPGAHALTVPGAGHFLWLDDPTGVLNAIDGFLRGG